MGYHCIVYPHLNCIACGECIKNQKAKQDADEVEEDRKFDENRDEERIRRIYGKR